MENMQDEAQLQATRICRGCKESVNLDLLVKNKVFKDGYDTICLTCSRQRVKEWRAAGKRKQSKRPASSKAYREIIIDFLIKRDGFICGFCSETLENSQIHIDHLVPVALGGKNTMDNVRLAHAGCNVSQSNIIRKQSHGF